MRVAFLFAVWAFKPYKNSPRMALIALTEKATPSGWLETVDKVVLNI